MEPERPPTVFVRVRRDDVREALVDSLSRKLPGVARVSTENLAGPIPGTVVVAANDATSPEECAQLRARGTGVIVLAAVPDQHAEARYLGAGALAYLPMALDLAPLVRAITEFLPFG